jgi:hypothetical protein
VKALRTRRLPVREAIARAPRHSKSAGYVSLKGPFVAEHRDEILALMMARERHAQAEHPLQRISAIDLMPDGLLVTTTDSHLARRIAHALRDAYDGELRMHYLDGEDILRVDWVAG